MSHIDDALNALDALIDTLPTEGPQAKYGIRFAESARKRKAAAIEARSGGWFSFLYGRTFSGIVRGSGELIDVAPEQKQAQLVVAEHCNQLEASRKADLDRFNAEFRDYQDRHCIIPSYPPEED